MAESPRPQFPLTRDESVVEMVELITGQANIPVTEAWQRLSTLAITEDAMRLFGWLALSTLVSLARRGDRKSAEALLNHAIGLPDKPFKEQVALMDVGAAAQRMFEVLIDLGVEPGKARAAVAEQARGALALAEGPA